MCHIPFARCAVVVVEVVIVITRTVVVVVLKAVFAAPVAEIVRSLVSLWWF